jgi:phospholipid/cholesterol/gamma-HCH transport system ATP-binding protein
MEEKETVAEPTEKKTHDKHEVVIDIKNLKKSFGSKDVLTDINLTVHRGENVVVLGRSGQGKSVTIQCIVGMLMPDGGTLKVLDNNVADLNEKELKELRMKIGFLFQSGALYDSMTVRENLEFPLTRVLKPLALQTLLIRCRQTYRAGCVNEPAWHGRLLLNRRSCCMTSQQPALIR